jgi:hypothetical protein
MNRNDIVNLACWLREQDWVPLRQIEMAYAGKDAREVVDTLHWSGVLRSRTVGDDLEYQWVK